MGIGHKKTRWRKSFTTILKPEDFEDKGKNVEAAKLEAKKVIAKKFKSLHKIQKMGNDQGRILLQIIKKQPKKSAKE